MATLSNLLGGGSAGAIDHRKEGLPLFGLWGDDGGGNSNVTYRVFDSGYKMVGSPWGAVCNSTTNYRFGMLGDATHAYSQSDHGTDVSHADLTSQQYDSWTNWLKSLYQCDQYPHAQYYTSSRDGYSSFHSYHHASSMFEFQVGWTKINMVLPEGCRPRRMFCNRRRSLREQNVGNNACANIDHYLYTSHLLDTTNTYASGTGYNEKNKMLVMVHSADEGSNTAKTIHVFKSSKDLNQCNRIKDYFDNLTATEYFTGTWTTDCNKDMTVVVGNNGWVGFGHKNGNSMRYAAFNCNTGLGLGTTDAARIFDSWQDFSGSTTTSYGANQGAQYYTKFNHTWDGTWGMIYAPYYYYGPGLNAFCMSIENPRKFISVNETKSSRSNPWFAWGRTGFHGGWSDNTDGDTWRTYSWSFDPTDSDHTTTTKVYRGATSGNGIITDDDSHLGDEAITNKTGNVGLGANRTFLHGGYHSTCYPLMMQIDWWGNYGNTDGNYGGNGYNTTD